MLLSEGFGELRNLKTLNLYECRSLLSLPAGLHTIEPACCSQRSPLPPFILNHPRTARPNRLLSEGFGELRSLKSLDLENCQALRFLPAGLHPTDPA